MAKTYTELFNNGQHRCISFHDLVSGDGIQANQFLVVDNHHAALIDPGGDLTYTPLKIAVSGLLRLKDLDYIIASHQDPDIIASLGRWMTNTDASVVTSSLWSRFLPHLISDFANNTMTRDFSERIISLPDEGGGIRLGNAQLIALPAHFLHSVGNFHFYDPVSRILFSGDMGASIGGSPLPVSDFAAHIPLMEPFHKRYMCCRKVCRLWVAMVRGMDVEMIVPQHGPAFTGAAMVNRFLDWISELECGIDLLTQDDYQLSMAIA